MGDVRKTIIIGSGPAGLTAAIYAARAALQPIVLAGATPGGQLTNTSGVENYPGFSRGINGPKLMEEMMEQAKWCGAELTWESATRIEKESGGPAHRFSVTASDGTRYPTHTVIFATGAAPRFLNVPGEKEHQPPKGEGVTYCAVCDGNFYRKMPVLVVGGGDSAMEEALYLSNICSEVTVVHRREGFRASSVMLERARAKANIKWELNQVLDEILGDPEHKPRPVVRGARLKNTKDGSLKECQVDGVFVAIGHIPSTEVLKDLVKSDKEGYLLVNDQQETSEEGIWAAGDCHDRHFRQAITAAGMGCKAALGVERYLARAGL